MASASLVLASFAPANSSGVSVGISRCNCSGVVMRCLSCQCQSFQSASDTSRQKPRPAEWNCFRSWNRRPDGGSLLSGRQIVILHFSMETINWNPALSSEPPVRRGASGPHRGFCAVTCGSTGFSSARSCASSASSFPTMSAALLLGGADGGRVTCATGGGRGAAAAAKIIGERAMVGVGQHRELRCHAPLHQAEVAQLGLENGRLPVGIKIADGGLKRNGIVFRQIGWTRNAPRPARSKSHRAWRG